MNEITLFPPCSSDPYITDRCIVWEKTFISSSKWLNAKEPIYLNHSYADDVLVLSPQSRRAINITGQVRYSRPASKPVSWFYLMFYSVFHSLWVIAGCWRGNGGNELWAPCGTHEYEWGIDTMDFRLSTSTRVNTNVSTSTNTSRRMSTNTSASRSTSMSTRTSWRTSINTSTSRRTVWR